MRTGEVFALTWDDIDLENRIIKINKTVYAKDKEENGRWYLGTAKTIDSHREIYICDTLYSFLLKYKELQKAIVDVEEHLQASRRCYNANVSIYNQLIVSFPINLVAKNKKMTKKDFFEIEESKKENVKIEL